VLASAIAARTSSLPILVAAALLPFYDPVRLAEDMTVLHHLSNGRVSWVLGLGYRPEEFEMFGVERGRSRVALSANRCRGLGGDDPVRMTCDALPGRSSVTSTTIARAIRSVR
jgi:alkanesulfonate monooxygenase SsuD/methylene tetrahydromethanopterin reductase-like flavin-dependent oxidoreductase (luciferase family)